MLTEASVGDFVTYVVFYVVLPLAAIGWIIGVYFVLLGIGILPKDKRKEFIRLASTIFPLGYLDFKNSFIKLDFLQTFHFLTLGFLSRKRREEFKKRSYYLIYGKYPGNTKLDQRVKQLNRNAMIGGVIFIFACLLGIFLGLGILLLAYFYGWFSG